MGRSPSGPTKVHGGHTCSTLVQSSPERLIDASARTGKGMECCDDGTVLGAYGRGDLNNSGKRLLSMASENKLTLTNKFFSARKGEISHRFNGVSRRNDRKRIDYILTRQPHRPRVYDFTVHPQPLSPAKAGSDKSICSPKVSLIWPNPSPKLFLML